MKRPLYSSENQLCSNRKKGYRNSVPGVLLLQIAPFFQRGALFHKPSVPFFLKGHHFLKWYPKVTVLAPSFFSVRKQWYTVRWAVSSESVGLNSKLNGWSVGRVYTLPADQTIHNRTPLKMRNLGNILWIRIAFYAELSISLEKTQNIIAALFLIPHVKTLLQGLLVPGIMVPLFCTENP